MSRPVLQELDRAGCVISMPGAPDQLYHQDGEVSGLVNAFVPLVPLTEQNGGTEFKPGTHAVNCKQDATVKPLASSGEIILFDYRILHRGCANHDVKPRPVAYMTYASPGVRDNFNFPERSLQEAASEAGFSCEGTDAALSQVWGDAPERLHHRLTRILSSTGSPDGRLRGSVKTLGAKQSFAFVHCPDTEPHFKRDVKIRRAELQQIQLNVGSRVSFRVELNQNGQLFAQDVQLVEEPASTA